MTPFPLEPARLADEIGMPVDTWPGNCHGVAQAVLDFVPVAGMRLARGHFHGHISRKSVYRGTFSQHSWLVAQDGRILDPTRWAMERPDAPFIYLGVNDVYDEAGLQLAAKTWYPVLSNEPCGHTKALARLSNDTRRRIAQALGTSAPDCADPHERSMRRFGEALAFALRKPPSHINAEALYQALEVAGLKSLIRLDLWHLVMAPEKITRSRPVNRSFLLPHASRPASGELFFELLSRFVSIEARENSLESELAEIGYSVEDLWDALNDFERHLKFAENKNIEALPRFLFDALCVIAGDCLGRGRGVDIEIERYAESRGYTRTQLDHVLVAVGKKVGYDLSWI